MAKTQVGPGQILDEGITRDDLNASVAGKAVIKKIIDGTAINSTATGVDAGTGDVTINVDLGPSASQAAAGDHSHAGGSQTNAYAFFMG